MCTNEQTASPARTQQRTHTHTHTHSGCAHLPASAEKLHHSICMATTICTQDDGENARWSDENNVVGGIIIKSQVLTQTETVLILGEQTLMRGRVSVWERERQRRDTRHDRWGRDPRMETKNTSVHVRHVKEDISWYLMPGNKITLIFFSMQANIAISQYCFSVPSDLADKHSMQFC